jgi:hypothetical protein
VAAPSPSAAGRCPSNSGATPPSSAAPWRRPIGVECQGPRRVTAHPAPRPAAPPPHRVSTTCRLLTPPSSAATSAAPGARRCATWPRTGAPRAGGAGGIGDVCHRQPAAAVGHASGRVTPTFCGHRGRPRPATSRQASPLPSARQRAHDDGNGKAIRGEHGQRIGLRRYRPYSGCPPRKGAHCQCCGTCTMHRATPRDQKRRRILARRTGTGSRGSDWRPGRTVMLTRRKAGGRTRILCGALPVRSEVPRSPRLDRTRVDAMAAPQGKGTTKCVARGEGAWQ